MEEKKEYYIDGFPIPKRYLSGYCIVKGMMAYRLHKDYVIPDRFKITHLDEDLDPPREKYYLSILFKEGDVDLPFPVTYSFNNLVYYVNFTDKIRIWSGDRSTSFINGTELGCHVKIWGITEKTLYYTTNDGNGWTELFYVTWQDRSVKLTPVLIERFPYTRNLPFKYGVSKGCLAYSDNYKEITLVRQSEDIHFYSSLQGFKLIEDGVIIVKDGVTTIYDYENKKLGVIPKA